jgi:hypothetical protein
MMQITDKLYLAHLAISEIRTRNVNDDCIGSCKSNYYRIRTMAEALITGWMRPLGAHDSGITFINCAHCQKIESRE